MLTRIKSLFSRKAKPETGSRTFTVSAPMPTRGQIEPLSPTWLFMENWAVEEINRLRRQNDSLNLTPERTTILRAKISLLKKIIDLPDPKPERAGMNT